MAAAVSPGLPIDPLPDREDLRDERGALLPATPPADYGSSRAASSSGSSGPPLDRRVAAASAALAEQPTLSFRNMNSEQRKKYARAMACRGGNALIETTTDVFKSFLSTLLGLRLSGLLGASTDTTLWGYEHLHVWLNGQQVYGIDQDGQTTVHSLSLGAALNGILPASLETLTGAAAAGWLITRAVGPRLQRILAAKEKALMRQINGLGPEEAAAAVQTRVGKVNDLLQYLTPFLFDATQFALFVRMIQRTGSQDTTYGWQHNSFDYSNGPLNIQEEADIGSITVKTIPGKSPLSDAGFFALFGTGIVAYISQAACSFAKELQDKGHQLGGMTPEQRKKCISSLLYRGARKALQTFHEQMRGALTTLSAIELSGFLSILTQSVAHIGIKGCITRGTTAPECGSIIVATAETGKKALEQAFNEFLILDIKYMIAIAAAAYGMSQTIGSYAMRRIIKKEEALVRQVLGQDGTPPADKPRTWAGTAAYLFDCICPLLDVAMGALLVHYVSGTDAKLTFPDTPESYDSITNPSFSANVRAGILDTLFEMTAGSDPVSTSTLWLLLAAGVVTYVGRAWSNFHHDMQTQEVEPPAASPPLHELAVV